MAEGSSTKSEDIGTLVLLLSEHSFQEYDPAVETEERERTEHHFSDLEYLVRHARNQVSFANRLPGFVRRLELIASETRGTYQHMVNGQGCFAKLLMAPALAAYAYGTYAAITSGFESPIWRGLFLGAMAISCIGTYVLAKRRKNRAILEQLNTSSEVRKKPTDKWREAFCAYANPFIEIISEFKDYQSQKI